jgi:hypothetical protein
MTDTTLTFDLLRDVPPPALHLMWQLADRADAFTLNDAALPEGGLAVWGEAIDALWRAGLLERSDWGRTVHVRFTNRAREGMAPRDNGAADSAADAPTDFITGSYTRNWA